MIFEFYKGNNRWVPLTKQTGEFLAAKTLRDRLGGVNAMKKFLGTDKMPTVLERSLRATTKLKTEVPMDLEIEAIPLKDLSSLAKEIHVKNTNLDLREILDIDRALQSIQGELFNNTSKLTEINTHIESDTQKLKEVENDSSYTDEQRQLYRDRLDDLNTEKQAKLETLSQNWKDLQTQVGRIKQTLEKVVDKDTSLGE